MPSKGLGWVGILVVTRDTCRLACLSKASFLEFKSMVVDFNRGYIWLTLRLLSNSLLDLPLLVTEPFLTILVASVLLGDDLKRFGTYTGKVVTTSAAALFLAT